MMQEQDGAEPTVTRIGPIASTLATEVYDTLLDALIEGRLLPGDRLVMDRLAEEMDVSRTPVRDALHRLFREGVIEPANRRGYVVREPSARDTTDFYAARMAVEGHAAALLSSAGQEEVTDLRLLLDDIAGAPRASTREAFSTNRQFHRAVVEATGNGYLLDMFDAIWNRSRTALTYRRFAAANPGQDFRCEHGDLLDAIDGADRDSARAAMVAHIRSGRDRTHAAALRYEEQSEESR